MGKAREAESREENENLPGYWQLASICWRQWRAERSLRGRGVDFRSADPEKVRAAYSKMSEEEFTAINGRHHWANDRAMRQSFAGLLPNEPVDAVDLGCGSGTSTEILCRLLPPGSHVIGVEFVEPLVEFARHRTYFGPDGQPQHVSFVVGSVADEFVDETGRLLPDESYSLVNASGVLGHHLGMRAIMRVADEVQRVLCSGGIAALDVGPRLSDDSLTAHMLARGFDRIRRTRGQPLDRTGQVVYRKRFE